MDIFEPEATALGEWESGEWESNHFRANKIIVKIVQETKRLRNCPKINNNVRSFMTRWFLQLKTDLEHT